MVKTPTLAGASAPVRLLLGGWSISNIMDVRSGLPFGISSGRDNSFSGIGQDRADLTGNPALSSERPKADRLARYFDIALATFNAVGTYGNSSRNFLRGFGYFNIDAAVQKTFALREGFHLDVRGEFFNLLNHANFSLPGSNVSSASTFGVINGAADPRILQIGLRLSF